MTQRINSHVLDRYGPASRKWLSGTAFGHDLYGKILSIKGCHVLFMGRPGSGKTRKMFWLVRWLQELETIVWFDTCKDEEISTLFTFGKPINIVIPFGMKIEIHKLGETHTVREAFMPDQFWDLIVPGAINIFSIRGFFYNPIEYRRYVSTLFRGLTVRAMEEYFRDVLGIERMSVFSDEAQEIVPSTSYTHEAESVIVSELITANILQKRAYGIRFVLAIQDSKSIHPIARRNMPARILCGGSWIDSSESPKLHKLAEYSQDYEVNEALIVYPNGKYFPRDGPWPFPDYPKPPGARIRYIGKVDRPVPKEEIEQEMPDLGRYAAQAIEPERDDVVLPSRYDIAAGDT